MKSQQAWLCQKMLLKKVGDHETKCIRLTGYLCPYLRYLYLCPPFFQPRWSLKNKWFSFLWFSLEYSENFCSFSLTTILLFKINHLKWQCSDQKPPFGWLCPKFLFTCDSIIIRLCSLNEMWKLSFNFWKYTRDFFHILSHAGYTRNYGFNWHWNWGSGRKITFPGTQEERTEAKLPSRSSWLQPSTCYFPWHQQSTQFRVWDHLESYSAP